MEPIVELGALGRYLQAAAEDGDWARVLEIDAARAELLAGLSAGPHGADRAALEEALAVTRTVLARAEGARAGVAEELRGLRRGQRGAQAYHTLR